MGKRGRSKGRGRGARRKRLEFRTLEASKDLSQEGALEGHSSSADSPSSNQETFGSPSRNSQYNISGDTSELIHDNIPLEIRTQVPIFAYLSPPDDLLFEIFDQIGNHCLKCSVKVEPNYMVLCHCGHFLCLRCFLADCFCIAQDESDVNCEVHDKDLESDNNKMKVFDSYETPICTSVDMTLDGEEYQLDCYMYRLRSKAS